MNWNSIKINTKRQITKYFQSTFSTEKHAEHSFRRLGFLYFCTLLSISLGVSIYGCAYYQMPETMVLYQIFYSILYISASLMILCIVLYVIVFREDCYELSNKPTTAVYSLRAEPINWYLRIGVLLFGCMSITHTVFRFVELWSDEACSYHGYFAFAIIKIIFYFLQILFVFRCHRFLACSNQKAINGLLLHILTTIICSWLDSVILKITTGLNGPDSIHHEEGHVPKIEHASIVEAFCNGTNPDYTQASTAYFLPALAELTAITAAIFYEVMNRSGNLQLIELDQEEGEKEYETHRWKTRAIPGLTLATMLTITSFGIIIYLDTQHEISEKFKFTLHAVEETLLIIFALFACSVGFYRTRKLKFTVNFTRNNIDELLLSVTYFIAMNNYIGFILIGFLEIDEQKEHFDLFCLRIGNSFIELFQASVQFFFIQDSFYRCCDSEKEKTSKPGRNTLAILLGLNFSLWIIKSFQLKHNDVVYMHLQLQPKPNLKSLYILATLPMAMLFRFHSTVCISNLFTRMYENEIIRFAAILRETKHKVNPLESNLDDLATSNNALSNNFERNKSLGIYGRADVSSVIKRSNSIAVLDTSDKDSISDMKFCKPRDRRKAAIMADIPEDMKSHFEKKLRYRRGTIENIELAKIYLSRNAIAHRLHSSEDTNIDFMEEGLERAETSQSNIPSYYQNNEDVPDYPTNHYDYNSKM